MGKTRLAQAAAHALRAEYADGVWFVELAPLADPALVCAAVVRTLGLNLSGQGSMADNIASLLRGRELVLVQDNCEHLVEAVAELVQALVERAPGVRVLATSQEILRCRKNPCRA